jgi:hypothetical protein
VHHLTVALLHLTVVCKLRYSPGWAPVSRVSHADPHRQQTPAHDILAALCTSAPHLKLCSRSWHVTITRSSHWRQAGLQAGGTGLKSPSPQRQHHAPAQPSKLQQSHKYTHVIYTHVQHTACIRQCSWPRPGNGPSSGCRPDPGALCRGTSSDSAGQPPRCPPTHPGIIHTTLPQAGF